MEAHIENGIEGCIKRADQEHETKSQPPQTRKLQERYYPVDSSESVYVPHALVFLRFSCVGHSKNSDEPIQLPD